VPVSNVAKSGARAVKFVTSRPVTNARMDPHALDAVTILCSGPFAVMNRRAPNVAMPVCVRKKKKNYTYRSLPAWNG